MCSLNYKEIFSCFEPFHKVTNINILDACLKHLHLYRSRHHLQSYNEAIRGFAAQYGTQIADVHTTSKKFLFDVGLVAEDGLHPSRRGHELWQEIIQPELLQAIREL